MSTALVRQLCILGLLALAGCGQKGALYLPDESIQTPVEIRTSPTAAPAAESAPATPATATPPVVAEPEPQPKDSKPPATAPR
jgi:predicted small lipoprotein YifL